MVWFFGKREPSPPPTLDLDQESSTATDPGREQLIEASLTSLGQESFPDNESTEWTIDRTCHLGEWSYVLTRPVPDDVGYPLFVFGLRFDDSTPQLDACWALDEQNRFSLLSTASGVDSVPSKIVWTPRR